MSNALAIRSGLSQEIEAVFEFMLQPGNVEDLGVLVWQHPDTIS
jgi:hypothetical protein